MKVNLQSLFSYILISLHMSSKEKLTKLKKGDIENAKDGIK